MANHSQAKIILQSLLASSLFLFTLCYLFQPIWETRDDLQMSMLIYGYGVAIEASSEILYSNVLWADLIRQIPTIHGILGYTTATLGVLLMVGAVIWLGLRKFGAGIILSLFLLILLLSRPILFPQFTINAGYLTVSAIIMFHLYAREKKYFFLGAGLVLATLGFLVRAYEFILVFLVALPVLPWSTLVKERLPKVAVLGLALVISGAALWDKSHYQSPDWAAFMEMDYPRAAFTDFSAVEFLRDRPELYQSYGLSRNDIDLIGVSFFPDRSLADPHKLSAMLKELGPSLSFKKAWRGIRPLYRSTLLPAVLCALGLALIFPGRKILLTWSLCLFALALFGFIGRPGIIRIYVPLICLLCIAPLFHADLASRKKSILACLVVVTAALFHVYQLVPELQKVETRIQRVRQVMNELPSHPIVIWGSALDFEALYPLLTTTPETYARHFYFIGWSTLAPNSYASQQENNGIHFLHSLRGQEGVEILMDDYRQGLLAQYCMEHWNSNLTVLELRRAPDLKMNKNLSFSKVRCAESDKMMESPS